MILFKNFTDENIDTINCLEEENELEKAVQRYSEAAEIISKHLSNSSDLLSKYPEISEVFKEVNIGLIEAKSRHNVKRQQREEREEEERQQRLRNEEQKRREEQAYWQSVKEERSKRGFSYGVPPIDNRCPVQFPIRATANIDESSARGIYYYEDERAVEVCWCFANPEEAKADNFRRPKKKPPKRQPR
ncbi:hypothetical protein H6F73_00430 [Microcoleus sp. FACHB-68]|nr:hypothetical protein [Microcoleus sp. FACHB-68]